MTLLKEKAKRKEAKEKVKRKPTTTTTACARGEVVDKSVDKSVRLEDIDYSAGAFALGIICSDLKFSAEKMGMTAEEVNAWLKYMDEVDWTFTTGDKVNYRNFRRSLRMWHKTEETIRAERKAAIEVREGCPLPSKDLAAKKMVEIAEQAKTDPSMWALCRERCANACECGCRRGFRIPPDRHLPRPYTPEECPKFKKGGEE